MYSNGAICLIKLLFKTGLFTVHVSVSELYIPTMGLPFLLEEIFGPILGVYKSLTGT
jgi:hypothetical protein